MSATTKLSNIRRVAVIGAGAGGLVAARALREEGCFETIDVLEQRGDVGGVWNYTNATAAVSVPSTDPTAVEAPVNGEYVSAVYDSLETNIPKQLMCFPSSPFPESSPLFPPHPQVLDYLRDYAKDLRPLIRFNTSVTHITPAEPGWNITTTASVEPQHYDAVIVATGHYNTPYLPSLPGLESFPGSIVHARNFRRPDEFRGKKVVLVGASASAVDLAAQLLPVVRGQLLQVVRSLTSFAIPAGVKVLPEIRELNKDGSVSFVDGTVEEEVDVVLFATGYLYTLPFLPREMGLVTDGERVHGVFQHVFWNKDPSLSFIGLPTRVIPFPLEQSQAAWVAGVYAGRLGLPGREEMEKWEREEVEKKGDGREFHYFGFPDDAEYMDEIEGFVGEAKGLEPARWRRWERWCRERVPEVKKKYLEAKKEGREVKELEELGFVYEE